MSGALLLTVHAEGYRTSVVDLQRFAEDHLGGDEARLELAVAALLEYRAVRIGDVTLRVADPQALTNAYVERAAAAARSGAGIS